MTLYTGFHMKTLTPFKFIGLVTLINLILYYYPLFNYVFENLNITSFNGQLTLLSTVVSILVISFFILYLFSLISSKLLKGFSLFMMIANSIALYFTLTYHVILDKTMMGNLFNTNTAEATAFYHPKIFLYLFFLGILPAYFLSKITITKVTRKKLLTQAFTILFSGVVIMYLNATTWLWLDKHAKHLGALAVPWSYTINAIRYQVKQLKKDEKQELLPPATMYNNEKMIVILVIGESARAENFSLYGYKKETNPYLKKLDVIALKHVSSSATYTTASVHSMLSYTGSTSDNFEPLPSYLQREGVDVIWRSTNWGEPPIHVRTYEEGNDLRSECKGEGCDYDEVLLTNLDKSIKEAKSNKLLIVLHTSGSHGPSYYEKYPKAFEVFKPVCKTVDLQECTNKELINAYDNTILYTDYFLAKVIKTLKEHNETPSLMLYASDHGESLGEYGLYLHGTPYTIAPDVQKDIPFILWLSEGFKKQKGLEKFKQSNDYSQKNIFHTIMGAFEMNSSIYNPELDILKKK